VRNLTYRVPSSEPPLETAPAIGSPEQIPDYWKLHESLDPLFPARALIALDLHEVTAKCLSTYQ